MTHAGIQRVTKASGFSHQQVLFRYLAIPICAKKISNVQCDALIENMKAKIRIWSTRNLSYMARTLLINVVLLSLHTYWPQVFILPQNVLHEFNRICRAFLWGGQEYSRKPGDIAWDKLCSQNS